MDEAAEKLSAFADCEVNRSLRTLTTLGIGGNAHYVVFPKNEIALFGILDIAKEYHLPVKMIGKGSDILASDNDYEGIIIRMDRYMHAAYFHDERVLAQAGCSLIGLSVEAMKHGLSGLEFASGIPATVGGAVFMNAGAYRSTIAEVLTSVLVLRDHEIQWLDRDACDFSYRSSIFQTHPEWIVLAAEFRLHREDPQVISDLMNERRTRRMASQPLDQPSCGSVFRNPEGQSAWKLIEGAGYRGYQRGDVLVSPKHCNFILNVGHANARDYIALVNDIQQAVKDKYGIELTTEMEKFNW